MISLLLHNYWRSSASYRVRIALALKKLSYDYKPVDIIADEHQGSDYLALSPLAQVPTLEVFENDGSRVAITQSLAIIEYLEERWPDPPLLPGPLAARARTRALAEIVNAGIQPLQNLSVTKKVKAMGGDDGAWVREFIRRGLEAYDKLVDPAPARFSVGDRPSLADCCLVPQLYAARRFNTSLAGLDRLAEIEAACNALPAFAAAHPDRQPDRK